MKKLVIMILLFCSLDLVAQNEPQKIINEFFKLYKDKNSDVALDFLFGTNKWMNDSKDQIENVKFKINSTVVKSMGEYFGYELLTTKTVGEKIIFYTYLVKYDRQPIRFSFLLYNPNGQWRLQNFSFDDAFKDDLQEASKSYRMKENLEY
ncbi:MAG: hypothetical protein JNM78_13590 [Cyclobacteriaceae bacterium]|nr:hypothetical protein [Cyclobacteriaceae bacterium]